MYDKSILSEKVAANIRQMIVDEKLEPGDKLPNELVMTEQLNVSRSTLREAIKILRSHNVLEVRRGRGTYVGANPGVSEDPLGITFMEEKDLIAYFFEVRLVVEPQIAELATQRSTQEEIDEIKEAYNEVKRAIDEGRDHTEADIHFHNIIAASTHNPIIQRIVPIINDGIKGGYHETKDLVESKEEVILQHRRIMKAITERDAKEAGQAMRDHITYGLEHIKTNRKPKAN
jgi:DNA-binding FadR family transcriptional regulator